MNPLHGIDTTTWVVLAVMLALVVICAGLGACLAAKYMRYEASLVQVCPGCQQAVTRFLLVHSLIIIFVTSVQGGALVAMASAIAYTDATASSNKSAVPVAVPVLLIVSTAGLVVQYKWTAKVRVPNSQ